MTPPSQVEPPKLPLGARLKALISEYGSLAIGVYLSTSAAVFVGTAAALQLGFSFEGASATTGTLAAAWVAVKLTQPFRILITLALVPIVGRFFRRAPGSSS